MCVQQLNVFLPSSIKSIMTSKGLPGMKMKIRTKFILLQTYRKKTAWGHLEAAQGQQCIHSNVKYIQFSWSMQSKCASWGSSHAIGNIYEWILCHRFSKTCDDSDLVYCCSWSSTISNIGNIRRGVVILAPVYQLNGRGENMFFNVCSMVLRMIKSLFMMMKYYVLSTRMRLVCVVIYNIRSVLRCGNH